MTVSSTSNRKTFAGDAVTTSFGTSPVVFFETSNLVVTVTDDATGSTETLVENTDYTVSGGDGSTGTVNLAGGTSPYGAPAADTTLVILRVLPFTQTDDYVNNDINDANVLEERLDRITMLLQQLEEESGRALRFPPTDGATDDLPTATLRASKYFGFDSSGDPTLLAAATGDIVVSAPLVDNSVVRLDGTGGNLQGTGLYITDEATNEIILHRGSTDATDNKILTLAAGGGAASDTRGAYIRLGGNENATLNGGVEIVAGDNINATIDIINDTTGLLIAPDGFYVDAPLINLSAPLFVQDTSNASNTQGVTINQAAADDEILSFKSTDVAHGYTTLAETDTFGFAAKLDATGGGLNVTGLRAGATTGARFNGYSNTATTTASTTARSFVELGGFETSGTGVTDATANALVMGVRTNKGGSTITVFVVDEDGDYFNDGASTASTTYDEWDDAALVRAFDLVRDPKGLIRSEWDKFVGYGHSDLVRAGILTDPKDGGRPMVNMSALARLHNGALWQLSTRLFGLEQKLQQLTYQGA